jgi:sugar lactone lactonase YvrE
MPAISFLRARIVTTTILFVLTACSGGPQPLVGGAPASKLERSSTSQSDSTLYVANSAIRDLGSVNVYDTASKKLLDTITDGINDPVSMVVDATGNLYVANRKGKNVAMYAPGTTKPALTITQGIAKPYRLGFDPAGELNVVGATDVTVYAAASGTLLRTIKNKLRRPFALTFDPEGDLFVLNGERKKGQTNVVEFAAGGTKAIRTFGSGTEFGYADDIIIGPDGYLYVADDINIIVLDPTTGSVVRTITDGVYDTLKLAFDGNGNLYLSNNGISNGVISVYPPGSSDPSFEIKQDDAYSFALLFDSQNDLYLASEYGGKNNQGMVAEFAFAKSAPKRLIETGMDYPDAAVFGP